MTTHCEICRRHALYLTRKDRHLRADPRHSLCLRHFRRLIATIHTLDQRKAA